MFINFILKGSECERGFMFLYKGLSLVQGVLYPSRPFCTPNNIRVVLILEN